MKMNRNIEIKARARDFDAQLALAAAMASEGPTIIEQHDTFYKATAGRLKLRRFGDGTGELIQYERADRTGPKTSRYTLVRVADPDRLHECLARAIGVLAEVRKTRTLYMRGRTRIHMDRVERLGDYIELEVVLRPGESEADGTREAESLIEGLHISPSDLVAGAYVDLLCTGAG